MYDSVCAGGSDTRLPPLLRAKGVPVQDALIVPPPRGLNPRFVSWKGACVMCHLESMSDMWIRRDEWDAIGARALKDRYLFF
jgi:actin-related protein 8